MEKHYRDKTGVIVTVSDIGSSGKHWKRLVRNIRPVAHTDYAPRVSSDREYSWSEGLTWTHYAGEVHLYNGEYVVNGWSFVDEKSPLYWGLDLANWPDTQRGSMAISAWGWLQMCDYPTHNQYAQPMHADAATRIRKYLGPDTLINYLGDLHWICKAEPGCTGLGRYKHDDIWHCSHHNMQRRWAKNKELK